MFTFLKNVNKHFSKKSKQTADIFLTCNDGVSRRPPGHQEHGDVPHQSVEEFYHSGPKLARNSNAHFWFLAVLKAQNKAEWTLTY